MTFSKVPFLYITTLFVTGVLLLDKLNVRFESVLFILLITLFLYIFIPEVKNKLLSTFRIGLLFISIISIGGVFVLLKRTETKVISKGTTVLLSIDEIASTDKDWRKAVCKVNSLLTTNSVIQHEEKVLLFFNSTQVQLGDVLLVQTNLERINNKNNPGEFDVKTYWNNKDIYQIGFVGEDDFKLIKTIEQPWWSSWSTTARTHLTEKLKLVLSGENLGVAMALLLGDKQLLSNEVRSSFSNAGAMHVLAVSGLHVGIVLFILMYVLGRFTRFISKKNAILISILIIWIYAGVTGFSPSVLRASFMFSVLAIAELSGRSKNPINILFFSAFILLLFNPLWIYDIGFQLSYLAMIGIFLLYIPISKLLYFKNKWLTKAWQGTAVGISAQAFTVPLTLYYFHQFPNYFILTNIGMMVFAGIVLGIGLFFFAVSWSSVLAFIASNALKMGVIVMVLFVQAIDELPFAVATGFYLSVQMICLIYFLIITYIFTSSTSLKKGLIISFFMIFLTVHFQRYQNMQVNEMVIFNSEDFSMAIKNKDQIVCFHSAKKERVKKIKMILKDYNLIKPGQLKFVALEDGLTKAKINNRMYKIYSDKYGVNIVSSKIQLYVRTNYLGNFFELDNAFDMAYLAKNKERYNLADGAKVISLN